MKKRLIALTLTTILLTPTTQSADWTAVIDAGSRYSQSLEGTLSVSDEAFWFGRSSLVSPESGKRLSVHEVPDRLTLEAGGQRAHSSRRGLLWHDVTNEVGAQGELVGDARSNGWGISAGDGSLMRRAADGAQTKRWSADQLGVPGFHLLADGVAPFRRSAGAWVLVQSDDGSISRILKLDEQGRELQRLDA